MKETASARTMIRYVAVISAATLILISLQATIYPDVADSQTVLAVPAKE